MYKGLVKFDWKDIDSFTEDDITYFLFLEGKPIDAICKIRSITKEEVQRHIIEGKIKYRFLVKSSSEEELFQNINSLGKQEKLALLSSLSEENKQKIINYIKNKYMDMPTTSKESALWIIGELKAVSALEILMKSIVHKHVNIRRMSASAMGKLGDMSTETALIRALEDENAQVVQYAIKSLAKLKSRKAVEKIRNIGLNADKEYLKRAAEEYLNSIEG